MRVLIIDYGMGNLASVKRALEECGGEPFVSEDPRDLELAAKVVLPGVGAFAQGMARLRERGWVAAIKNEVIKYEIPLLGICLGMQLLADKGFEGGEGPGLGLIPGEVKRLEPDSPSTRIPHAGWNEVQEIRPDPLLKNIPTGTDFYFVHSYHFVNYPPDNLLASTPYCGGFASILKHGNTYGVQFHPEKSQRSGFQLLRNFLSL